MSKKADLLAQACIAELIESGATNYQEHHFEFTIDGEDVARPVIVTVQFKDGLSPHQLRVQAEEALARMEAERDLIISQRDHNLYSARLMTEAAEEAQAQLAEAMGLLRDSTLYTAFPNHEVTAFLARHAKAKQQEAQGAQAGDEHQGKYWAFRNEDGELCITDRWDVAKHIPFDVINLVERAALATQPADGEPIQVEAVAITREDEDGLYLDWVLEGGISALEAPGVVLLVAHGEVTDDQGSGEVYLAPPAAAPVAAGEPVEIEVPTFSPEGMGCGLEDRGITDRYEAMEYGYNEALEQQWTIINRRGPLFAAPPVAAHGDEPVGEASSMPGSNGFTLAVFKAEDVPIGTKLYTYSKKDKA